MSFSPCLLDCMESGALHPLPYATPQLLSPAHCFCSPNSVPYFPALLSHHSPPTSQYFLQTRQDDRSLTSPHLALQSGYSRNLEPRKIYISVSMTSPPAGWGGCVCVNSCPKRSRLL